MFKRADVHLYRLMGSTHAITATLAFDELHGKKVKSKGTYSPQTDQVLVVEKVLPVEC